jgi:Family of unknown function (DUF6496)
MKKKVHMPKMHMEEEIEVTMPKKRKKRKKAYPKGEAAEGKMEKVMHEYKEGALHSGSKKGPKVKSRAQAIAIGLSEARKAKGKKKKK